MVTTYQEAVDYLYANLPMFQRVGAVALKNDLSNTLRLCEYLGNPERTFRTIHVAGTNGKGSTSHMLASVLQTAGYKTGLYTSPHLKNFTERIRINGLEIPGDEVVRFVNRIRPAIEEIQPSFFEITVAMAFEYYAREKVDIAVIEVGLGGRLDSTNVITPLVSVITNIGWDHKDILGDTLEKIASEKAGIIKPGVPVVISLRQPALQHVFEEKAALEKAPIFFADEYSAKVNEDARDRGFRILRDGAVLVDNLQLPLRGLYQEKNLPGVFKAIELLQRMDFHLPLEIVVAGLERTVVQTGLKGRWQQLGEAPLIICDTGHNVDGITEVMRQIRLQRYDHLHIVIGMVKDKAIDDVLKLLPVDASYYFCQANIPRALDAGLLAEKAKSSGLNGIVIPDVNDAIREAKKNAVAGDFIFIGGSTFVVAEIDGL